MTTNLTKLGVLACACAISLTACQSTDNKPMSDKVDTVAANIKEGAKEVVENVKEAFKKNDDSDFVVNATLTNKMELNMLEAGVSNGTDKDVKAHARMMIADHKKLGDKVKAYADSKGYLLPADDMGKSKDKLESLNKNTKGKDWDKAWADDMVDDHDKAISQFEGAQNDVKDSTLKGLITDALPTLRKHKDMAQKLKDKFSK